MTKHRHWLLLALIALLAAMLILGAACAKKSTGDDDDDDDTTDDDVPESGVGSYMVYLNMVPVLLGELVEPQALTIYDAGGEALEVEGIVLGDLLAAIDEFADDAEKFAYELIDFYDNTTLPAGLVDYADLANVAFYENPDQALLCVGWLEEGHADHSLCDMGGGAVITHPLDGAFDWKTIEWINERDGDQPAHLGEEAAAKAVVTVGTGTIVAGEYVKTFMQQDGYGVKVFADTGATETNQGYDGQLFKEIYTFEGDELFVYGRVTVHDGMIEYVPVSGYHMAVLSTGNETETPVTKTIDELDADPYRYAGALVRIDDVEMVDVDPEDPTTDWPEYGTKSKDIRIYDGGSMKIGLSIYEGTGIPGSTKPEAPFDIAGAFNIDGTSYLLYPRKIEDVNPTEEHLSGSVRVSIYGEDASGVVNLALLPAGLQPIGGGDPVPVVSIAAVINAAGIARNPKLLEYKPVAYDGRKPFNKVIFDEMKAGVFYQGEAEEDDQPDPMLNSYFWEGMNLSDIYFLNGVTDVHAFREIEPPPEGEAEHGEGLTLTINGVSYVLNFADLPKTDYEGQDAIRFSEFIHDSVIELYTMDGSFTVDQIKELYDYRLVSFDGSDETLITVDELGDGYVILDDDPYTVFPGLGNEARVDDVYLIDMMRLIRVDFGEEKDDPVVVYLRDCPTEEVEVEDGVTEDVVFFRDVLVEAGYDITGANYLWDFWLIASDDFVSTWTYGHNHLEDMYYRPYANRGWTVDPGLESYGGRVSTKAILEIELHAVPQEAPSIEVEDGRWGSDAESCEGCHFKHEQLQIPIDCFSCHTAP